MKQIIATICTMCLFASFASAQQKPSPSKQATGTIGGKTLTIKYDAPSVRGRQIFGAGGLLSEERNYPVWRAGANPATIFHTDADLDIAGVAVPKGDYSLYVLLSDPSAWQLIINKQTGQWGLEYDQSQDLGRVKMTMSKSSALIEQLKYTIASYGPNQGKIQLEWEHQVATVLVAAK